MKSLNSHYISAPLVMETICMNSPQVTRITQLKNETFGLVSRRYTFGLVRRLLERDSVNYRKPYG